MTKQFRALRNNYLPALIFLIGFLPLQSRGQTVSEITRILNPVPQSITVTSATANNSNLFNLDLTTAGGSYKSITVTIKGTWVATITPQASQDNFTTTDAIPIYNVLTGAWVTSITANGTFQIPLRDYRYFRLRTTAFTSGTVDGAAYGKFNNNEVPDYNTGTNTISGTVTANQGGTWTVQPGNTANTTAWKVDGSAVTQPISGTVTINAIPAGTNNIGDVDVLTVPADPFGVNADAASATGSISAKLRFIAATGIPVTSLPSVTIGTFPDNEPFNVAQINGVTPLMGAGNGGTGSLRVNIATDQLAIPVTLTSTTITGTVAVTKSGTWDITNAGTFVTQPASATVPISTMNSASANSGLNSALAGVFDDVTPTAITENSFGFLRMSANRNLFGTIRDAAGNERGANVNASNELLVALSSVPSHAVTNAGTFATQVDGAALTALQLIDNLPNTLGSTTSGQSGALALGAVTTAAPSYTTAQSNALSLTTAGALRVDNSANTQPVSGTVSITANSAVNVAQINGVTPLMGNGVTGTGSERVTLASDMTAISTTGYMSVKFDQTTPGTTNGVSLVPTTTGGLTTYHLVSAATTNATNIKASAGQLYGYYIFNANAAARKVAFHNSASAPTAGASVFFSVVIPASSGANVEFSQGLAFSSGIGITTVTGTADSDATAVASGDLIINLFYKSFQWQAILLALIIGAILTKIETIVKRQRA